MPDEALLHSLTRRLELLPQALLLLIVDLHGDHAKFLGVGSGECELFKAPITGGVESHLHAVKVVSLDRRGHHLTVRMASHADKARHFLLTRFHQTLESSICG